MPRIYTKSNRRCDVEGCNEKHYGNGLCQKHYWRFKRKGSTDLNPPHVRPEVECSVEGCDRIVGPKSARGLCISHYSRVRYGQELEGPFRKYGESHVDVYGYRFIHSVGHPLARKSGYVAEQRMVAYEKYGSGPQSCHWCHQDIGEWSPKVEVDHIDGDKLNNSTENLVTSCGPCNISRANQGNPADFAGYQR